MMDVVVEIGIVNNCSTLSIYMCVYTIIMSIVDLTDIGIVLGAEIGSMMF